MIKTKKQKIIWFVVALIAVLATAPNNALLKFSLHEIGPLWLSLSRFLIFAIALLPALYLGRRGINEKSFKFAAIGGVAYTAAILSISSSIVLSQASYPSLVGISSPIILMLLSVMLANERVPRKSFLGIIIAAIGGFLIIFLPLISSGAGNGAVNPLATLFAVIGAVASPMMYIMAKKSVDAGMKIWTSLGVVAWVGVFFTAILILVLNAPAPAISNLIQPGIILPIIYSVVVVMLFARSATTLAYKKLGSAPVAGLEYLRIMLSVFIPVIALGERLSIEMALGGGLILAGVILIEARLAPKWSRKRKSYGLDSNRSTIE